MLTKGLELLLTGIRKGQIRVKGWDKTGGKRYLGSSNWVWAIILFPTLSSSHLLPPPTHIQNTPVFTLHARELNTWNLLLIIIVTLLQAHRVQGKKKVIA